MDARLHARHTMFRAILESVRTRKPIKLVCGTEESAKLHMEEGRKLLSNPMASAAIVTVVNVNDLPKKKERRRKTFFILDDLE